MLVRGGWGFGCPSYNGQKGLSISTVPTHQTWFFSIRKTSISTDFWANKRALSHNLQNALVIVCHLSIFLPLNKCSTSFMNCLHIIEASFCFLFYVCNTFENACSSHDHKSISPVGSSTTSKNWLWLWLRLRLRLKKGTHMFAYCRTYCCLLCLNVCFI